LQFRNLRFRAADLESIIRNPQSKDPRLFRRGVSHTAALW
jgi:hypothetical protein